MFFSLTLAYFYFSATSPVFNYDVIVYGGTPSGVASAVASAEEGLKVLMVSEYNMVGGTMSNGLGASDIGARSAIGGFPMRFFDEVRDFYGGEQTWRFESKVAEDIFYPY